MVEARILSLELAQDTRTYTADVRVSYRIPSKSGLPAGWWLVLDAQVFDTETADPIEATRIAHRMCAALELKYTEWA